MPKGPFFESLKVLDCAVWSVERLAVFLDAPWSLDFTEVSPSHFAGSITRRDLGKTWSTPS
jgi:hypothetical protein